jgi:carbon-monoxide dehydrogenase small subunit
MPGKRRDDRHDRAAKTITRKATMTVNISLRINGKPADVQIEGRTLLVDLLRNHLGLTGTHVGCDTSQCGACTVHVDGRAVKSCSVLAVQMRGADITTIEGLAAPDGTPHPMQQAFADQHGLQCGFCTPGMVMSAIELVQLHPDADAREIREQLAGNLCRCTGYQNIVKSVQQAAKVMALPVPRAKFLEGGGDVRH